MFRYGEEGAEVLKEHIFAREVLLYMVVVVATKSLRKEMPTCFYLKTAGNSKLNSAGLPPSMSSCFLEFSRSEHSVLNRQVVPH